MQVLVRLYRTRVAEFDRVSPADRFSSIRPKQDGTKSARRPAIWRCAITRTCKHTLWSCFRAVRHKRYGRSTFLSGTAKYVVLPCSNRVVFRGVRTAFPIVFALEIVPRARNNKISVSRRRGAFRNDHFRFVAHLHVYVRSYKRNTSSPEHYCFRLGAERATHFAFVSFSGFEHGNVSRSYFLLHRAENVARSLWTNNRNAVGP